MDFLNLIFVENFLLRLKMMFSQLESGQKRSKENTKYCGPDLNRNDFFFGPKRAIFFIFRLQRQMFHFSKNWLNFFLKKDSLEVGHCTNISLKARENSGQKCSTTNFLSV